MGNSVTEAQEQFSRCFGELSLSHMCGPLVLPPFSNEVYQLDEFIAAHQKPAPVVINIYSIERGASETIYNFG